MLRSLLRPSQTDFGALDIAAMKDALSGLERHVDPGAPMSIRIVIAVVAALALSGRAIEGTKVAQDAKAQMVGMPKEQV